MFVDINKNNNVLDKNTKTISNITDSEAIRQSVRNIVSTEPGDIPGFPEFGCPIKKSLFEQLDFFTIDTIKTKIKYSLNKYEPRINNISVTAIPSENALTINISYNIKAIQEKDVMAIVLNTN